MSFAQLMIDSEGLVLVPHSSKSDIHFVQGLLLLAVSSSMGFLSSEGRDLMETYHLERYVPKTLW